MDMKPVIRFELRGLSAAVYRVYEDDRTEIGWMVVSTSTKKTLHCISFEHARHVWDGCVNEIRDRLGFRE